MSNPNDKDYKGDNDLDDIFTSHDDPMNETSIPDAVEDNIDDISDYDDSEDGIFAPPPEKKKSSSSALLGTVAVLALLGAGGFYVYKNPDLLARFTSNDGPLVIPTAEITPSEPVEVSVGSQEDPGVVEVAQVQDNELENIPQPQPIANVEDAANQTGDAQTEAAIASQVPADPAAADTAAVVPPPAAAVVETVPPANDKPVVAETVSPVSPESDAVAPVVPPATLDASAAESASLEKTAPTPVPDAAVSEIPAPPTPAETKAEVEATKVSDAEVPAPTPEVKVDVAKEPALVKPEVVATTKVPEDKVLVGAPKPQKKEEAAKPVAEKPVVTKPAKVPETVYFDAPKGKALTDIPTPSMNTKRGKNESIIIVGGKVADAGISSTNQDSGVAAANRALKLGRYDAAYDMFSDLYASNPRDVRILMGRAVALQKLGRSGEAIRAYEDVLSVDDNNPEAIVNMMGLVRKEYPALALEKLLTLHSQHPDNAGITAQLGIAYADSGNLEDAATSLMQASRMEPNNPQHYFNLGVVAERMKNRTRAIAYYEKALEVDAVYGNGRSINRDMIYDRLTRLRD